jgi:imidazolonepropionase-like amidohydrolase
LTCVPCGWRLAALVALTIGVTVAARQARPAPVAIVNVTLVDGTGAPPMPLRTVVVRDGRIAAIGGADTPVAPGTIRVDGSGRFLIPGLIDAHVHIAIRPDAEVRSTLLAPLLVAHGVLGVRDMGGDLTRLNALRASIAAGHLRGPAIVTPGPFIDGPQEASATVRPVATAVEAARAVAAVARQQADFIKVQAGLSAEIWRAVVAAARAAGLHVAGHVPEAMSAFDVVSGGQRTVEHVSPALPGDAGLMLSVSTEEAAIRAELRAIGDASVKPRADVAALRARQRAAQRRIIETIDPTRSAELFALMRDRGVIAVPTLAWSNGLLPLGRDDRPSEAALSLVPRALAEPWQARRNAQLAAATDDELSLNRDIADASRRFVGAMHRAGVAIAAGTDSFDSYLPVGLALHRELEELVASGLTPYEALQAATRVAARAMERAERGTIEVGKVADAVLLDADPTVDIRATRRIHAVVHRGEVLDAAALAALVADLRASSAR